MKKSLYALCAVALMGGVTVMADEVDGANSTFGSWGIDLSAMDNSVKPSDDFFAYVNGKWLATAKIPADRTSTGSFQNLQILSEKRMKEIVAELEAKPYKHLSAEEKKLRDLYDAYMDTDTIEKKGLKPVMKDLKWLASLKTYPEIAAAMGTPGRGTDSLFDTNIEPDANNSNIYVMNISQGGLGMPDRDYYLRTDSSLAAVREAYKKHLNTMLTLSGEKNTESRANAIFALETEIAKASWPAADRRETDKTYNPMTFAALEKLAPGFSWVDFFKAQGLSAQSPKGDRIVIVNENTAFPQLAKIFHATPVAVWRDWLLVHYIENMSAYLPKRFDDANFEFHGKALIGQQQQLDRATRGVHQLDGRLSHPFGKLYVARYFSPQSKAKVEALIANLLKTYDADIRQLPWMTETTRQKALEKLHAFKPHVGYPDQWRDFSGLKIDKHDLIGNIHRSDIFEWQYHLNRIDQPTDRNEWQMTPSTINAYYTQNFNSIFFPAAILQPPFFDPNADDAVNYGGIGAVIGHEISHGFDDQGSKYDGEGYLRSWWTDADRKAFEQRTAMLVTQFNAFEALPGMYVNGQLTLGENIGDLSGLTMALKAYHLSQEGKPAKVLDGFTGDQRFFLSWGQVWRGKYRESELRKRILSDPHSPVHFRVNGTIRNVDDWYTAFNVKPNSKEYLTPEQRVKLW